MDECGGAIVSTEVGCLGNDTKEMWTFNEEQKNCEL